MMEKTKLKKYLGLCNASRSAVCGSELAIEAVRKNSRSVCLMLLASDASKRTAKQITDKCAYYNVELIKCDFTMSELSDFLGKNALVSACAITNKGLALEIKKVFREIEEKNKKVSIDN